jgi:hypothetical protein
MTGFFVDAYEVIGFNHEGMKIAVSAYRSCGGGIDRLRELHGMAMVRAKRTGDDWFLMSELLRLHDRKGHLTAVWRSLYGFHTLAGYVEQSWIDLREESIEHRTVDGTALAHGLCSPGIREYARLVESRDCELCDTDDERLMMEIKQRWEKRLH